MNGLVSVDQNVRMYRPLWRGYYTHQAIDYVVSKNVLKLPLAMDVEMILSMEGVGVNAAIAAILHTVYDGSQDELREITRCFEVEVVDLIEKLPCTDPNYEVRTASLKDCYKSAGIDELKIIMAENIAGMRKLEHEYELEGERAFINDDEKERIEEYYTSVIGLLRGLMDNEETEGLFLIMMNLYKRLFVKYYYYPDEEAILQVDEISSYTFFKCLLEWDEGEILGKSKFEPISQEEAEDLERSWNNEAERVRSNYMTLQ